MTVDPEPQVMVVADANVQDPARPVSADTPADSGDVAICPSLVGD